VPSQVTTPHSSLPSRPGMASVARAYLSPFRTLTRWNATINFVAGYCQRGMHHAVKRSAWVLVRVRISENSHDSAMI